MFSRTVYSVNKQEKTWDLSGRNSRNLQKPVVIMPTRGQGMSSGEQTCFISQAGWQQEAGDPRRRLQGAFMSDHVPIAHLQPVSLLFVPRQTWYWTASRVTRDQMEFLVCEKASHAGLRRQIPHHSALLLVRSPWGTCPLQSSPFSVPHLPLASPHC